MAWYHCDSSVSKGYVYKYHFDLAEVYDFHLYTETPENEFLLAYSVILKYKDIIEKSFSKFYWVCMYVIAVTIQIQGYLIA